jgi:hypothetical protein
MVESLFVGDSIVGLGTQKNKRYSEQLAIRLLAKVLFATEGTEKKRVSFTSL